MELTSEQRAFLSSHDGAAMTTLCANGTPYTVRAGCVPIGDVLWSGCVRGISDATRARR